MFTQKLSMDCSQEQYEKYLKAELEKMGYEEGNDLDGQYIHITNRYNNKTGVVNGLCSPNIEFFGRTYLGKFNAPLFLALAAMTDNWKGNYGELWRNKEAELRYINDWWKQDNVMGANNQWRKATVSEIMAKFGEQPLYKGAIAFEVTIDTAKLSEQIDTLKNTIATKEEEQMVAHLKTKGYRIFKQTTTLEEV